MISSSPDAHRFKGNHGRRQRRRQRRRHHLRRPADRAPRIPAPDRFTPRSRTAAPVRSDTTQRSTVPSRGKSADSLIFVTDISLTIVVE